MSPAGLREVILHHICDCLIVFGTKTELAKLELVVIFKIHVFVVV